MFNLASYQSYFFFSEMNIKRTFTIKLQFPSYGGSENGLKIQI